MTKSKDRSSTTLRRLFLRRSVPYGLFVLVYAISIAASWYLSSTAAATAEARARSEFEADALQIRRQIQAGLNSYFEVVRAGAVLLSADTEINGAEFRRFVAGLQLRERYPGLEGIGFAQCVRGIALRPLLRSMDLDGNRVRIWPAERRTEHCPTIFLEPADPRNKAALGFDLTSEPGLTEAMARARDLREPEVSSKLATLKVREKGWRGDFVLLIPVYRVAGPLRTVEARRQALIGFVFSPFNSERLLEDIVTSITPSMEFGVYDGPLAIPATLLSKSDVVSRPGRYQLADTVQIAGRNWLVVASATGEPVGGITPAARQTLFGGVALSFMLFLITAAQVQAWERAARHEAELRSLAQALRESESQAQAANRAKDEFLATLSHELRTPLNVVLGWVSMLRHGSVRANRRAAALEIIERNARQQAELIDDLLDVSRIVAGKLRVQLIPVAFGPIVSAVVESLSPSAEAKGITITVEDMDDPSVVRGDVDRLHQIAWNLLSNAIKFTPEGGQVFIALTNDERHVALSVRDTGVGIAADFLPHVFERFRQADSSTTRTHGGVGLGLAIVRHLVELHGGTIEAHSEGRGKGATFIVSFPAAPVARVAAPAPVVASLVPTSAARLEGVRVLVVDDDRNTLDLLTEALAMTGARVTAADSARHALERLNLDGADIIVSDLAMPDEDGFWLMNRVRALPGDVSQTPAIALTALARSEDRTRALEAGFQMYLTKPVELAELQATMTTLIAQPREEQV